VNVIDAAVRQVIAVRETGDSPTVAAGRVIELSVVSLVDSHIFFGV
jgi:hypothetical protein